MHVGSDNIAAAVVAGYIDNVFKFLVCILGIVNAINHFRISRVGIFHIAAGWQFMQRVHIFFQHPSMVTHNQRMGQTDITIMPWLIGHRSQRGFVIIIAQNETIIPAVSQQPLSLLGIAEVIRKAGVIAQVNRQTGLVLTGSRQSRIKQRVVISRFIALAGALPVGYFAVKQLFLYIIIPKTGNCVQR